MYCNKRNNGFTLALPNRTKHGFTLIEVLITMLVISVGILGVAAMQAKSLQFAHSSFERSVAVLQANDLAERLWAGVCDLPDALVDIFNQWEIDHSGELPGAWNPSVLYDDSGILPTYGITIEWTDGRAVEAGFDGADFTPAIFRFTHHASIPLFDCEP